MVRMDLEHPHPELHELAHLGCRVLRETGMHAAVGNQPPRIRFRITSREVVRVVGEAHEVGTGIVDHPDAVDALVVHDAQQHLWIIHQREQEVEAILLSAPHGFHHSRLELPPGLDVDVAVGDAGIARSSPLVIGRVKVRQPLLEKRPDAFRLVFAREAELKERRLEAKAFLQRKTHRGARSFLGRCDRHGTLRCDQLGDGDRAIDQRVGRNDFLDEAELQRVVGRDHLARENQAERVPKAHDPREALGPAAARDDAEVHFGLAELRVR